MSKVVITGAGGSAATNLIDSLLINNPELQIVSCDSSPYMLKLAKGDEKYLLPRANEPGYLPALKEVIRATKPDALFSQPDVEVTAIVNSDIQEYVSTFLPDKEVIRVCGDKGLLNTTLKNSGISIPDSESLTVGNLEKELQEFIAKNGKCWVRARVGAGSRASLPVTTAEQAINWINWWVEEKNFKVGDFMISEYLPGSEFAVQLLFQDGQLISGEARERVEYLFGFMTPSGQSSSPSVARTTSRSDIYDLGIDSVKSVTDVPNGVFGIDIKEDSNGIPKVTEINAGRFYTTSHFLARAGVNMPDMAFKAAKGEKLSPIGIATLEENLHWIRMMDMGCCLQRSTGEILWRST